MFYEVHQVDSVYIEAVRGKSDKEQTPREQKLVRIADAVAELIESKLIFEASHSEDGELTICRYRSDRTIERDGNKLRAQFILDRVNNWNSDIWIGIPVSIVGRHVNLEGSNMIIDFIQEQTEALEDFVDSDDSLGQEEPAA